MLVRGPGGKFVPFVSQIGRYTEGQPTQQQGCAGEADFPGSVRRDQQRQCGQRENPQRLFRVDREPKSQTGKGGTRQGARNTPPPGQNDPGNNE